MKNVPPRRQRLLKNQHANVILMWQMQLLCAQTARVLLNVKVAMNFVRFTKLFCSPDIWVTLQGLQAHFHIHVKANIFKGSASLCKTAAGSKAGVLQHAISHMELMKKLLSLLCRKKAGLCRIYILWEEKRTASFNSFEIQLSFYYVAPWLTTNALNELFNITILL